MPSARTLQKLVAQARTEELRGEARRERQKLTDAKAQRRVRLQAITEKCRAMRAHQMADSKRQREELRAAIAHARDVIKNKCAKARGKTDEETAAQILAAMGELDAARERLQLHLRGIKLPPKDPAKVRAGQRRAELLQEEIDQVGNELEGAGAHELLPVWESMARRMPKRYRGTDLKAAYEGFLEWAADHPADVAEIQDRALTRSIRELEKREVEEQRAIHDEREARRRRELRKLTKLTPKAVKKLDHEGALSRFEAVVQALQDERDAAAVAELRRVGDILQSDLVSRGLLAYDPNAGAAAAGEVPF